MGEQFSAEEGALRAGAGHVATARQTLTTQISTLGSQLDALQGQWVGTGAASFTAVKERWTEQATRITTALDAFEANLTGTDEAYGNVDESAKSSMDKFIAALG